MKNITYKSITIFLLFIIFIILNTGKTQAVLQSNGNTSATYNVNDWILNVRKMEQLGGAMGLSETLNSNLTSSSSSNNIDVHMEKNTEYGALVILSASSYGNPNKVEDGQTTTGNATGVVMKLNNERVCAASSNLAYVNAFTNASKRYKNVYEGVSYIAKLGDAIMETSKWHGAVNNGGESINWIDYANGAVIIRSTSGSIFSYSTINKANHSGIANYEKKWSTRAVVVSGERFIKKRKEHKYNNEKTKKLY